MAEQNFGEKLVGSIGWLLIGILIFLSSFYVLYKGEMRTDYSGLAEKAVAAEEAMEVGDLVYATGELHSPQRLGDDLYLDEWNYLVVDRNAEMFAWVEVVEYEDDDKIYTYDTKWVEEVPNSDEFESPRRHENPEKTMDSKRFTVPEASVGDYKIEMDKIRLAGLKPLKLSEDNVTLYEYEEIMSDEDYDYIFDGYGTFDDPEIGDIRIRYSVLHDGEEVTVFGKIDGKELKMHRGDKERNLYRMFEGEKEDAIDILKGEYKTSGWLYRIGGFLLMWIGLMLILKPLSVLFEAVPYLGKLGKSALGVITFVVALILTFIVSAVLSIFHSWLGLIVIIAVVVGIGFYVNFMKTPAASTKK